MKKLTFLLIILLMSFFGYTQDTLSARDQKLFQALQMKMPEFKAFTKEMKDIQQKILTVHKDGGMPAEQKMNALAKLHEQQNDYIKTHLSEEEQRRLEAYNKANEKHSEAYYKWQQGVEKRKQRAAHPNGS